MATLDGPTQCENKFSGSIGKAVLQVNVIKLRDNIQEIDMEINIIELENQIIESL